MDEESRFKVQIPKFKLETSHNLKKPLQELGMTKMFDVKKVDFSGISGANELFVSHALQKAFIEVNEEGSEAGAATALAVQLRSLPAKFICDRPFMFVIKDKLTGMVLFNGWVVNPIKQ